ncbi:hypothetical protein, partial [Sedimentibacter sp. B4]|uniref:hypothetical protein n=1 Tax=Sedimentibacter sp. B4 TaxID=304766 RepID=UPI000590D8E8
PERVREGVRHRTRPPDQQAQRDRTRGGRPARQGRRRTPGTLRPLFYGTDWADESAYDLVVDTSDAPDAEAIAQITEAVQTMPRPAPQSQAAHLKVDQVLAETVAKAIIPRGQG